MPEVGDWLEATENDLFNPIWYIKNGLMAIAGWQFQWYREDDPIPGATEMRYEVVAEDAGSRIRVEVIAYDQYWRETPPIMSDYTDPVT